VCCACCAGLAQLPTTALNSVVAVSALAHQLYPHAAPVEAAAWRPSAVATSVGVMNLLGVWWGALPCCHGAGGLAAQHKFGARSGAAPVMLGAAKLVLGLCFGSSLFQLLQHFPGPLLGSLLLVAGLELARSVQRLHLNSQGFGEMLVAVAVMLGVGDIALGFGCGVVLHVALLLQGWVARRVPLS
jgi:MFS superfamily sulfate permease-like transporter